MTRLTVVVALTLSLLLGWVTAGTSVAQTVGSDVPADVVSLDFVTQTPGTTDTPETVIFRVGDAPGVTEVGVRVRLFEPATTRQDLWLAATRHPPTTESHSWFAGNLDLSVVAGTEVMVSVAISPNPDASEASETDAPTPADSEDISDEISLSGIRPAYIELFDIEEDSVIATLRTFLTPPAQTVESTGERMLVAGVVDLRLPPSHLADGGAGFEAQTLNDLLQAARSLSTDSGVPLPIQINPETLDALTLIGDDTTASVLTATLARHELVALPWTTLTVNAWVDVDRSGVVVDGLRRGYDSLTRAGLSSTNVIGLEATPSSAALASLGKLDTGPPDLLINPLQPQPTDLDIELLRDLATKPSATHLAAEVFEIDDASRVPVVHVDTFLSQLLHRDDPELARQWAISELWRLAIVDSQATIVIGAGPANLTELLALLESLHAPVQTADTIQTLRTAQLSEVFERARANTPTALELSDGDMTHESETPLFSATSLSECCDLTPADADAFSQYLEQRQRIEARLDAYEALVFQPNANPQTQPAVLLQTLVAVSASAYFNLAERSGLLDAVDQQITQLIGGIDFVNRGRVTITESPAHVPLTLLNNRPEAVTVALTLDSERARFAPQTSRIVTLQPGRNDLSIMVAANSGSVDAELIITTPDPDRAIVLSSGVLQLRRLDVSGIGLGATVCGGVALAAWWLRSLQRRRSCVASDDTGTVTQHELPLSGGTQHTEGIGR